MIKNGELLLNTGKELSKYLKQEDIDLGKGPHKKRSVFAIAFERVDEDKYLQD